VIDGAPPAAPEPVPVGTAPARRRSTLAGRVMDGGHQEHNLFGRAEVKRNFQLARMAA